MGQTDQVGPSGPQRYRMRYSAPATMLRRVLEVGRQRGWPYVARQILGLLASRVSIPFGYVACRLRRERTFELGGRTYRYAYHLYGQTWRTERAVELPFVHGLVMSDPTARVLEVGNVLRHFYPVEHDVVDKYERSPGVLNVDVVDLHPEQPYDLIVCISTLEHVGWDESPRDAEKPLRAIEHLASLLRPGGKLVYTVPLGYNHSLDEHLRAGRVAFTQRYCLKRVSRQNTWREVEWPEIAHAAYGRPFTNANGVVIGVLEGR